MNFRQIFSFIQTKLKLKNKQHVGLYHFTVEPSIRSVIRLNDNSVVIFGFFDGYVDSNGINYTSRNVLKFTSTGEVDTTFINNIGTSFNSEIWGATTDGSNLYIVGSFTSFNGVANNARRIAKLSTSGIFDTAFSNNLDVIPGTKASTSGFNNITYTIATDGTNLYIGGTFTDFKGVANNANRIAKLSTSGVFDTAFSNNLDVVSGTKALTSGFNQEIYTVIENSGNIFLGGAFQSFKGTTDNARHVAKLSNLGVFDTAFSNNLDVVSGTKASTSGFNTSVRSISTDGSSLYLAGNFTSFKGVANNANRIAKLSTSGVFNTAFSNNLDIVPGTKASTSGFNNAAYSIFVDGVDLYIGGTFTDFKGIGNNTRKIAKLSTSGVFDTAFSNNLDVVSGTKSETSGFNNYNVNTIYSISSDSTSLYIGGTFFSLKNNPTIGYAKISKLGMPEFLYNSMQFSESAVETLAIDSEGNRYVGGGFTHFNGQYVGGIAKILPNGELDQTFTNNTGRGFLGSVQTILLDGTDLYVGGEFTAFNGVTNNARGIAKLSTSGVFDTAFSNNLDVVSGVKASTSGFTGGGVYSILKIGSDLYIGGIFTSFKGVANNANRIAKLSTSGVFDTAFSNNLDVVSGTKASTSGFDAMIHQIVTDGTNLYIVGNFITFKGTANNARGVAKLSTSGVFDTAFSNNLDVIPGTKASTSGFGNLSGTYAIATDGTNLYIGGTFTGFKGIANNARYIAKLSTSGVFDTVFSNNLDVVSGTKTVNSGFDNGILSITLNGSDLYIGGYITGFKGISNNSRGVAKLSTSGTFDTAFSNNLDIVPGTKASTSGFNYWVFDIKYNYKYKSLVICGNFNKFKTDPVLRMYTISLNT